MNLEELARINIGTVLPGKADGVGRDVIIACELDCNDFVIGIQYR